MPQASDELRAKMQEYFGDPVSDEGPMKFLQESGIVLTKQWIYISKRKWSDLSQKEKDCSNFLADEWDFGGYMQTDEYKEKFKDV
jgi:hypothetical protein